MPSLGRLGFIKYPGSYTSGEKLSLGSGIRALSPHLCPPLSPSQVIVQTTQNEFPLPLSNSSVHFTTITSPLEAVTAGSVSQQLDSQIEWTLLGPHLLISFRALDTIEPSGPEIHTSLGFSNITFLVFLLLV